MNWPELLRADEYSAYRDRFETWFGQRARDGTIAAEESRKVKETIASMSAELQKHIREVRTMDYLAARKFIDSLAHEATLPRG